MLDMETAIAAPSAMDVSSLTSFRLNWKMAGMRFEHEYTCLTCSQVGEPDGRARLVFEAQVYYRLRQTVAFQHRCWK
jgi:hypothetical protein